MDREGNLLSNENLVIAWQSTGQDKFGDGVFAQVLDMSGNKIENEFQLNSYTQGDQKTPFLQSLNIGGYIATWNSDGQDGDSLGVYGQRFDNNGSKIGNEFLINTQTADIQKNPERQPITQLADGNLVVVWSSNNQDGDDYGIFAQILKTESTSNIDLSSNTKANSSLTALDTALQTLNAQRSLLGALSNRLNHTIANNTNAAGNISIVRGRIEDADFATETTNLAKYQILQQAATAMLAQANASKQNILTLLQD